MDPHGFVCSICLMEQNNTMLHTPTTLELLCWSTLTLYQTWFKICRDCAQNHMDRLFYDYYFDWLRNSTSGQLQEKDKSIYNNVLRNHLYNNGKT